MIVFESGDILFPYSCCCSVTKLCPTHCDLMDCNMPCFPVLHYFPEFAQTHVHRVGDAIQQSLPLLSPSSPAFSLSQYQGLFQWVRSSKSGGQSVGASALVSILPINLQDWFPLGLTGLISFHHHFYILNWNFIVRKSFLCPPPPIIYLY